MYRYLLAATGLWLCLGPGVSAQSNYADQGINVEYQGKDLPEFATLDGKVTKLDSVSPVISLDRTQAKLNCASGSMDVEMKFKQNFFGIVYANNDRHSACVTQGQGEKTINLVLPLQGCGTEQGPTRVFTNNIVVRFHPDLEIDGDEVITIVCRYPPPIVPPVVAPTFPSIQIPPVEGAVLPPRLREFEILLIICAILFLALLLLGIGCSYYCLKKRNIKIVRKKPLSMGPGSEITKLSGSTLGNLSMFDGLKIPRAHATSTTDSEAALVSASGSGEHSDTIPSDYPSESPSSLHSEVEDVDTRSLRRPSTVSSEQPSMHREEMITQKYENRAFVMEESSVYSDQHLQVETEMISASTIAAAPKPEPKFDVAVRIKKPPKPEPEVLSAQERTLTTILEREETRKTETETKYAKFTHIPQLLPPVSKRVPPPVYTKIQRRQQELLRDDVSTVTLSQHSVPDDDVWSIQEHLEQAPQRRMSAASAVSLNTLNTEMTDTRSVTEFVEERAKYYAPPRPKAPSVVSEYPSEGRAASDVYEPDGQIVPRKADYSSHYVDDVYLSTLTQTNIYEDTELHTQDITEYHTRPKPEPPKWDVVIRNYPPPQNADEVDNRNPEWEKFSTSSESTYPGSEGPRSIFRTTDDAITQMSVQPLEQRPSQNWSVLTRVLEPPTVEDASETALTDDEKEKWHKIITTESTLRTLLTEATVKEDYEKIRHDERYEKLFEPKKWDVIIRVISPPPESQSTEPHQPRYKKKSDYDNRSRRSSLPPVYEYDLESSARSRGPGSSRSRKTSRSSLKSEIDVRSMTEEMVNFAKSERDTLSDVSGPSYADGLSGTRSMRDRSATEIEYTPLEEDISETDDLYSSRKRPYEARSTSEFSDDWGTDRHYTCDDELISLSEQDIPEGKKRVLERSSTEFFEDVPQRVHSYQRREFMSPEHSPRSTRSSVGRHRMLERSSTEILVSPRRAVDRDSSCGEKEEVRSMAETYYSDYRK